MSVNVRIRNGLAPDAGDGGASEGDIRGDATDIIQGSGVVDVEGGHLLVHQAASPDMTVIVDQGVGYIPNDSFDEFDSDSVKFWEAVVAGSTGSRTLTIGANSSGQTRIDLACLKINPATTPDEFASNIAQLIIVAGTPGSGAPALPSYHLLLATVTVLNGATSIPNAKIVDGRNQIALRQHVLGIDGFYDETDSSTITFDIENGKKQRVTITDNRNLTLDNMTLGQCIFIKIVQDGSGNSTPVWTDDITWMTDDSILLDASKATSYLLICTGDGTYDGYKTGEEQ